MNDALLSSGRVEVKFLGESSLTLLPNWFPSNAEKIVVNYIFVLKVNESFCNTVYIKRTDFVDMISRF